METCIILSSTTHGLCLTENGRRPHEMCIYIDSHAPITNIKPKTAQHNR